MTVRPDPGDLGRVRIVKLSDGEANRVRGERREVAEKPARTPKGCCDGGTILLQEVRLALRT